MSSRWSWDGGSRPSASPASRRTRHDGRIWPPRPRYRDLFETNGAPILIVDKTGVVVEANPAAVSIFGSLSVRPTEKRLGELVDRQVARQLLENPATSDGRDGGAGEKPEERAVVRVTVGRDPDVLQRGCHLAERRGRQRAGPARP